MDRRLSLTARTALVLWALFFHPLLGAAQEVLSSAAIRGILEDRIDKQKQGVGIVVGVLDKTGRRVVGYGKLGGDRKGEPDGDTVFEIGSITKAFTGTLLQDMVDRGVVKLDDPIAKYLPKTVKVPTRSGKEITLEHLATHTSGLARLPDNMAPADVMNPYADYTVDQLYQFLSGYSLPREIGAESEYSNLGLGLLGHILALKAGSDYESLVTQRILGPLGMKSTSIKLTADQRARLAGGHDAAGSPVSNWDLPTLAGAGALRSTVNDLFLLLAASLGSTKTPLASALEKSQTPRHVSNPEASVGLGWHIRKSPGSEIVWHNGGTGGYHSFFGFDKAKGVGVVVLANSAGDIDDIGWHLLNPKYELAKGRTQVALDPKTYDSYRGNYELFPGFVITVTREGDRLFAQATGQPRFEVYPESETKFFLKVVDAQITFQKDPEGKVTGLVLHQGGRDQPAKKVK